MTYGDGNENIETANAIMPGEDFKFIGRDENVSFKPTLRFNENKMYKYKNVTSVSTEKDMYVGTLTADKVVYAGAKHYVKNSNYYLSTKSTEAFWLLSASKYKYGNDEAYRMFQHGALSNISVDGSIYFRPAINLKNGTEITKGDGTQNNPYVVGS